MIQANIVKNGIRSETAKLRFKSLDEVLDQHGRIGRVRLNLDFFSQQFRCVQFLRVSDQVSVVDRSHKIATSGLWVQAPWLVRGVSWFRRVRQGHVECIEHPNDAK